LIYKQKKNNNLHHVHKKFADRNYSTFSTAFKQRMQKSVAAWMSEEALV
jgi:hypothetical protein